VRRRRDGIADAAAETDGGDTAIAAIKTAGSRIQRTADCIVSGLNLADGGAAGSPGEGET